MDSIINLAHHAKAKSLRMGPDKQSYAPDIGVTDRLTTYGYRSWMRRVRQALINGCQIVYDAGCYPAPDESEAAPGSWQEAAGDPAAWEAYSAEVAGGEYRDSVPPPGAGGALWAAGLQVDVELIGLARAQAASLGLNPDEYVVVSGPNEPGATGEKGGAEGGLGWNFDTGGNSFADWMNFHMSGLRAAFPTAQIETPILGGLYNAGSVQADLATTLAALETIAGLGFDWSVYTRFAINCYISYSGQQSPDADGYAVAYAHKAQSIAGKLAQLGMPSRIAINEIGISKSDMNIGWMSMVGQGIRLRKCLELLSRMHYVDRAMIYKACGANPTDDSGANGEYAMIRAGSGETQGAWKTSVAHLVAMEGDPPATANASHPNLKLSDHADMGSWASQSVPARSPGYWAPDGQPTAGELAVRG